jgi:hypothetical protein
MSGSFVWPEGSKRMCANFETYTSSGTPYCKPSETAIMNEFMRPASVVPSLAMSTKMSPGVPSS